MKRITQEYFSSHDQLLNILDEHGVRRVGICMIPGGSFSVSYYDSSGEIRVWAYGSNEGHFTGVTEYEPGSENAITIRWRRTDKHELSKEEIQQLSKEEFMQLIAPPVEKKMPPIKLDHISECVQIPDKENIVHDNIKYDASGTPISRSRVIRSRSTYKRRVESWQTTFLLDEIEELKKNRLLEE